MKDLKLQIRLVLVLLSSIFLLSLSACEDEEGVDPMIPTTGNSKTYALNAVADPNISGTVTFEELENSTTKITIDLNGTPDGGIHPAHIHMNSAAESGGIAVSLNSVDGSTGTSETIIAALDDGTAIAYSQLLDYDGYVNVHLSANDLATIVAQGDIGANELTGETKEYALSERAVAGISGTATFAERKDGTTLVTLMLEGTPADGEHPAHIHMNSAAEGGGIAISLSDVDGNTGMSMTQVEAFGNGGEAVTYTELLDYDGYINVHLSADDLGTIVAQGDIGANAPTGNSETYTLNEVGGSGVTGQVSFIERKNGETLVTIVLNGTVPGDHPAHIHSGSVAEAPGGILVPLTDVNSQGLSFTNVTEDGNENALTYADMINIDGYVNVHLSASDLATLVVQGDVGQNAE